MKCWYINFHNIHCSSSVQDSWQSSQWSAVIHSSWIRSIEERREKNLSAILNEIFLDALKKDFSKLTHSNATQMKLWPKCEQSNVKSIVSQSHSNDGGKFSIGEITNCFELFCYLRIPLPFGSMRLTQMSISEFGSAKFSHRWCQKSFALLIFVQSASCFLACKC